MERFRNSPQNPTLPFAWSLSSWLADFFQSSMRSCSGLMRLSSSALRERTVDQGSRGPSDGRDDLSRLGYPYEPLCPLTW